MMEVTVRLALVPGQHLAGRLRLRWTNRDANQLRLLQHLSEPRIDRTLLRNDDAAPGLIDFRHRFDRRIRRYEVGRAVANIGRTEVDKRCASGEVDQERQISVAVLDGIDRGGRIVHRLELDGDPETLREFPAKIDGNTGQCATRVLCRDDWQWKKNDP